MLCLFLDSFYPGFGISAQMHYGNNHNTVFSYLINNAVWKTVGSATASSFRKRVPGEGILDNPGQCGSYFSGKFETKACALRIVKYYCFDKFLLSR